MIHGEIHLPQPIIVEFKMLRSDSQYDIFLKWHDTLITSSNHRIVDHVRQCNKIKYR
jgi:hypothetical protein